MINVVRIDGADKVLMAELEKLKVLHPERMSAL